jgi:hypothetical protein
MIFQVIIILLFTFLALTTSFFFFFKIYFWVLFRFKHIQTWIDFVVVEKSLIYVFNANDIKKFQSITKKIIHNGM